MIIELLIVYLIIGLFAGVPLAYALFRNKMSWFEIGVFGMILGILLPNITYAVLLLFNINFVLILWIVINGIYAVLGLSILAVSLYREEKSVIHTDKISNLY
ncbi:MAG: hypothetical protein ACYCS1_05170 [Gammaproteobacteria bacterium]